MTRFFLFAIYLALTFYSFPSVAKAPIQTAQRTTSELSSFSRVLSYDELMRLSPAKRAGYIHGLRSLFKNLEAAKLNSKSATSSSSSADFAAISEQHRLIANLLRVYDLWIGAAEAALPSTTLPAITSPRKHGMPYFADGSVSCSGNFRPHKVYGATGDNRVNNYICVSNQRGCPPESGANCEKHEKVLLGQTKPCGTGFYPVKQDSNGAYYCATTQSFARTPVSAQRNMRMSNYLPMISRPGFVATFVGPGLARYYKDNGPSLESLSARMNRSGGASAFEQKPTRYGTWENPTESCPVLASDGTTKDVAPPEYAASVRARCAAYAKFGNSKPLPPLVKVEIAKPKPQPKAQPKPDPKPQLKPQPVARVQKPTRSGTRSPGLPRPTQPAAAAETATPETAAPETAAPELPLAEPTTSIAIVPTEDQIQIPAELQSCSPESPLASSCSSETIEAARRKYASDSNPDCIYAGSVVGYESGMKRSFKCEPPHSFCFGSPNCKSQAGESLKPNFTCGSKSVICNPLLFGVRSDGKTPFCVEREANATLSCDSLVGAEETVVQPLDQNHAGIREAWNDFADRVFQLCHGNETSMAVHCAECDVIKKRLFALNVAARDVKTCGAAIKFEASNCTADGKCAGRPGSKPSGAVSLEGSTRSDDRKPAATSDLPHD